MSRLFSPKTAARILCALFVLASAAGAGVAPAGSVQAQSPAGQQAGIVTDTWAVQIAPGVDADQLAQQMGAENLGQVGSLTGYYLFRIPGSDAEATATADVFAANSAVLWFEQQVARQQSKRVITDPLYPNQWHLADANAPAAWALDTGYTGSGVTIAVVDDGLQYTHPDLSAQYVAAGSWDYNGSDSNPMPDPFNFDFHGTSAAGVAAANNDGASCGVGVAYDAGLAGIRLIAAPSTDSQEAAALTYAPNTNSIYSNSWGPLDDALRLEGPGPLTLAALANGVATGRNGKGSIYVWAGGNGRGKLDNVNYDGYANSRYTIAVGAVGDDGKVAPYSEPGAALFVVAPSSGNGTNTSITTTDLMGNEGYNTSLNTAGNCALGNTYSGFGGTSAAAPLVSGVVALMLQANPNLGWRDVQHILARTAVQSDLSVPWAINNAGFHLHHDYGFGLVDAAAAVAMAKTWSNVGSVVNVSSGTIVVNQAIPDFLVDPTGIGVTSSFVVSQDINLEHVEVVFNATHDYRGDLKVVLTAPSGIQSILADKHDDGGSNYADWKFMTVRDWGEGSVGTWTLTVYDKSGGTGYGTFNSWQLNLYGTNPTPSVVSSFAVDANPSFASSVDFNVTFSRPVSGVDAGDFALTTSGVSGASVTGVVGSGSLYTVTVNTGSGNGTIRLDVVDDDSILEATLLTPLGGAGTGNGNFTAGQSYTMDKTAPAVLSSLRVNPNPTNLASVDFTVTFSEPVTGVDLADFNLTTSGVSGAAVSGVSGSGAVYTVSVGTGSGSGTIRLNVGDDDTIEDAALNPLGGVGAGNGNYSAGQTYDVDKNSPTVASSLRADPNPTTAASVNFTVTFSEPVSGVDAADFNLTLAGSGVSTAAVTGVTPSAGLNPVYTVSVSTGTGNGTIRLNVVDNGTILDGASFSLFSGYTSGEAYRLKRTAIFEDVPLTYWANDFIERLYYAGVTGGCSATPFNYCPDAPVTRAQMAVFLLRGIHGSAYVPPAVGAGTNFTDVPVGYWADKWIKQLAAEGITSGCGAGIYCPEANVSRAQMAVFLLKAKHGPAYSPPAPSGVFSDVPIGYWADKWIERLAAEGITAGCGVGIYCPDDNVTRAQMAIFLVRTFGLP
jgi:subtilisin-like proprotein convertase family protein